MATETHDTESRTFTERRERGLTLDALQAAIETHIGMDAERVDDERKQSAATLMFRSPSGAPLFMVDLRCFDGRGWCVASHSGLVRETADALHGMHEEEITVRMTRRSGEVVFEDIG
ncbi:MAG: hypothetical protein AAGC60_05550 [Acidobacteriota bacterium]